VYLYGFLLNMDGSRIILDRKDNYSHFVLQTICVYSYNEIDTGSC